MGKEHKNLNVFLTARPHMKSYESLDHYLSLPWHYKVDARLENNEPFFVVCIEEWPEICGEGPSEAEAMMVLEEALEAAIKHAIQFELEIPLPKAS